MFLHVICLRTMQCVTPFYVATSMSGICRNSFMATDGAGYTREAVATIDIKRVTYGCISHHTGRDISEWRGEKLHKFSRVWPQWLCCDIVGAHDRGGSLFSNNDSSPVFKAYVGDVRGEKGGQSTSCYIHCTCMFWYVHLLFMSLPPLLPSPLSFSQ